MNFNEFINQLQEVKNLNLPGEQSQFKMSPPFREKLQEANKEKMKNAKKAGVMALFYPKQNETYLILILRKTYKGVHSAQVGFPGGRFENDDPNLEYTALRETFEEVGVAVDTVEVMKPLTPLYIPPSNFTVAPFLGITQQTPAFVKQDEEVEDLIEVKLSDLLDDANITDVGVMTSYEVELEVPAILLNGHVVWGATAMMLSELKDLLKMVM
ncbi:CoA pyrophosphatase [Psychroserpens sp. SPM9]|uniref:NUDIX hydrolase n=1 Tax=Psychroserpens sp. SPM9 TaxID=2975598 RepID=UPI0021A25CEF|nr:CoA pyrophosphatase [Psychroserpens sp. SPM9]MDG5492971.1 CoA pyrophosphatase [Psychroserpens sp. SPM9]